MSRPAITWRPGRVEGAYTYVQVDYEPGRTGEVPVRTTELNTPAGEALIRAAVARWDETRDQLREFE